MFNVGIWFWFIVFPLSWFAERNDIIYLVCVGIIFRVTLVRYFCGCVQMMDKSWIDLPNRMSSEYINGIDEFLVFAYTNRVEGSMISCPCRKCENRYYFVREVYGSIWFWMVFFKNTNIGLTMGNLTYLCMVIDRRKH